MTNEKMWKLVHQRILYFRKRIFEPLGLCVDGDVEKVEKFIKGSFNNSRNHSKWLSKFIKTIEETETNIVLHKIVPKSFEWEMNNVLTRSYFIT